MKNKGYTLLELLGVIVILAILVTLVFPSVINFIKSSNDKKDKLTTDLIISATESYIKDNSNQYSAIFGNTYCIPLDILVGLNYLDDDIVEDEKSVKVTYEGKFEYEIVDSNACYGVAVKLESNLIPVVYNGENWVVVDVSKEQWFNYDNQQWANVVILDSSVKKNVGDVVTVEGNSADALAMFVWIPRYSYTIGNIYGVQLEGGSTPSADTPGAIDIKFVSTNIKETGTATYTGSNPTNFRTHPAFTFGVEEVPGIWVGKFETSHKTLSLSEANNFGCVDTNCENADGIIIRPNIRSIGNQTISTAFFAARSMSRDGNPFRINSSVIDSHMMKNSEWAAVAYLTQSKYGKYGNDDYTGKEKEIYINNSNRWTGRSGGSYGGNTSSSSEYSAPSSVVSTNYYGFYTYDGYLLVYNTLTKSTTRKLNKVASTTGNITGIYDMSGGGSEYVISVFANSEGTLWSGASETLNSGFKGQLGTTGVEYPGLTFPNLKYYDVYSASSGTTISSRTSCDGMICYGHALSETVNWYKDNEVFITTKLPWIVRGGAYGSESSAGVFRTSNGDGSANTTRTFRIVLTPVSE